MSTLPHGAWRMNVAAIIIDDAGNLLLGTPAHSSRWHFPQGGVKSGESTLEALEREVREEVGLTQCHPLAEYAGLRYTYRRKNEKSKRWLGQQQTYYLLHYPGITPPIDCSGSTEFATAEWKPLAEVTPERFASFKRQVIAKVLKHFFPESAPGDLSEMITRCTTRRYIHHPGQEPDSPTSTPLFAGKREEALYHQLHTAPIRLGKKQKLLVVITGMEGCGIKKCLRNISHSLDPLATRYHLYPTNYAQKPHLVAPASGEISFITLRPKDIQATAFSQFEEAMKKEHVQVLKVALHLSRAKQLRRLSHKGCTPAKPWESARRALLSLMDATSAEGQELWRLLPAEHGWYRDFLFLNLLRSATLHYSTSSNHV